MRRIIKRTISAVLVLTMLMVSANVTVYAQGQTGTQISTVQNDFIEYKVNSENGGFTIKTVEGSPVKKYDQEKQLLYNAENLDTSFTTFRIDGKDYIYGNRYGFLNMQGDFINAPHTVGKENISKWQTGNLEITQTLKLVDDANNSNAGNVLVKYTVKNNGSKSVQLGARMLLDTMLDNNDAPIVSLNAESSLITTETRLAGEDMPEFWRCTDDPFAPKVLAYGFLTGWENTKPDEMVIGHWSGLSESKWDYNVDNSLYFTERYNKYGSADSAVALYWNPSIIGAGKTKSFETYYGIGNFSAELADAGFNINVVSPVKLKLNRQNTGYTEGEFEITADVDNTLDNAKMLTNAVATLSLEEGLELVENEEPGKYKQTINKNEIAGFTWKVRALPQQQYSIKQFKVDVQADGMDEPLSVSKYIMLPGVSGTPPPVQFNSASPENLFYQDRKMINLKGAGFDIYKDKGNWEMYLQDISGSRTKIADEKVTIVDDEQMIIQFEGEFELGEYAVFVDYQDGKLGLEDQLLPFRFNMSDDPMYRGNYYGISAVKKYMVGNKWTYDVETFASEDELENFKNSMGTSEELLMEIRGDITEMEDSDSGEIYYVVNTEQNPVSINGIIQYSGEPMVIKKDGNNTIVSGDGLLNVINGMTFWKWGFEINLVDGEEYALKVLNDMQKEVKIEYTGLGYVLQTVGGFLIDIQYGILKKVVDASTGSEYKAISFGGKMALTFVPNKESDKKDDDRKRKIGGFSADVKDVMFGERKDEDVGFRGINTTMDIQLPTEMLGGIVSNGFSASLSINTIDNIYGLDFAASIQVIECEGTLTIIMMDDIPLPDEVRFVGGGKPGIALVPGVLYINRLGGGYSELYKTIMGTYPVPPLTLNLATGVSVLGALDGAVDFNVSLRNFSLKGELELAKIPVLKEVYAMVQWVQPIYFEMGAKVELFDIIVGQAHIYISPDYFEGWARVVIKVPDYIPLAGGFQIAGAEVGISSIKVWGAIEIIGIGFGVAYYWDDQSVEFIKGGEGIIASADCLFMDTINAENGQPVTMLFGTNAKRLASTQGDYYAYTKPQYYASLEQGLDPSAFHMPDSLLIAASADGTEHTVSIQNQEIAMLQIDYSDSVPEIEIFRPDGQKYQLILSDGQGDGNYIQQEIPPEESKYGVWEKYLFVSITNPQQGNWNIKSDQPVDVTLIDVESLPVLNSVSAQKLSSSKIRVVWDADNTEDTKADIYLTADSESTGMLLAEGINASLGTADVNIPVNTASGDYYIRVSLKKGDSGFQTALTNNSISLVNTNEPQQVQGIEVTAIGDGKFRLDIQDSQSGIDGYFIEAFDSRDNSDACGQYFVENGENVILGGQYNTKWNVWTEEENDEEEVIVKQAGLVPGQSYRFGVTAIREIDENKYFSQTVYSGYKALPVPDPADISVTYGPEFINGTDEDGNDAKIANSPEVTLSFSSDMGVSTTVKLNQLFYDEISGRDWDITIPAEDGDNTVQFISVNEDGDVSSEAVSFIVDTTSPQLMIESPVQGQISENGKVRIKGITDSGAELTANGVSISLDGLGQFDTEVEVDTGKFVQSFVIQAEDKAGNVSIYETVVVNDLVEPIESVYIKTPSLENNSFTVQSEGGAAQESEFEMEEGQTRKFSLLGVDGSGAEVLLDSSQVKWSMLQGEGIASVSPDGYLTAHGMGEAVLLSSFYISEDYAFEDAVKVVIEESTGAPQEPETPQTPSDGGSNNGIIKELEKILKNLLNAEQGLKLIDMVEVFSGKGNRISISDEALLYIPEGALGQKDMLLMALVENPETYMTGYNSEIIKLISEIYELALSGQNHSLNKPVELTFRYDPSEVTNPEALGVYYYNKNLNKWQFIGGEVDTESHEVKVTLEHFSKYALLQNTGLKKMEDMNGRWSERYVYGLISLGIVDGVQEGEKYYYKPQRPISRLEFIKLAASSMRNGANEADTTPPFTDWGGIPEWGRDYVKAAYQNKLVTGIPTQTGTVFNGSSNITRAEAAVIIGRALSSDINVVGKDFKDADSIPSWAKDYVDVLSGLNIIGGYSDGTFRPNQYITREEAAKIISLWLEDFDSAY